MVMYDVRGIQKYIFRTAKIKDAIGASAIVEHIIEEALSCAVKKLNLQDRVELEWFTKDGILDYRDADLAVQVLYIGGGNAYAICESRELCLKINRIMARYIIENTYSLQLATAIVEVTDDYTMDYADLMNEMSRVKAEMTLSKPLGALPVMAVEVKTGYPSSASPETGELKDRAGDVGTESILKLRREKSVRRNIDSQIKILDNYTTRKGVDSTLAVVHIDGNNMGLRIRNLISKKKTYVDAVNEMRRISYYINSSYQTVFKNMCTFFNEKTGARKEYQDKKTDDFVLKILVAGDDITYVCNGKIALATVEYYCSEIAKYTMTGETDEKSMREYGFSVCAGVAYIGSHFPFHVGYDVAEACCESAKDSAKLPENKNGERIGNWVDFQICKNIQARDLETMRAREYMTSYGEQLLARPYFIRVDSDAGWPIEKTDFRAFDILKRNILYFQNEENIPRSFAKNLRNVYPQGKDKADMFLAFLESRNWEMPDKTDELFLPGNETVIAKYYDALELLDYYIDLDEIRGGE
ncbi:MAG: hypothetical protein LIO96_04860 [Lachnospiraceae bacterium]|nr:hypothetical protein [Lachnospiraceae bacterium]